MDQNESAFRAELAKQRTKRIKTISINASVITAILAAALPFFNGYANLRKNDQSHEREIFKYEMEYIKGFADTAMQEDLQLRLRLAEYFKSVSVTTEQQERWDQYYKILKAENDQ